MVLGWRASPSSSDTREGAGDEDLLAGDWRAEDG